MGKSLAGLATAVLVAALIFLAGHFLWPTPPDPRAAPWLMMETTYRGQVAALEHDTTQMRNRIDSLRSAGTRQYGVGKSTLAGVVARLDSLRVVSCGDTTVSLRAFADSIRYAEQRYAEARNADSLALLASDSVVHRLTFRLQQADSLIAGARPIIVDAKQHPRWPFVVAGAAAAIVVLRVLHP